MSVVICEHCDCWIDSDFDGDCFVEVGNMKRLHKEIVLCEPCRDRFFEEQEMTEDQANAAMDRATGAT